MLLLKIKFGAGYQNNNDVSFIFFLSHKSFDTKKVHLQVLFENIFECDFFF